MADRPLARLPGNPREQAAAGRTEELDELVLAIEDIVPARVDAPVARQRVTRRQIEQSISVHPGIGRLVRGIEALAAADDVRANAPLAESAFRTDAPVLL